MLLMNVAISVQAYENLEFNIDLQMENRKKKSRDLGDLKLSEHKISKFN